MLRTFALAVTVFCWVGCKSTHDSLTDVLYRDAGVDATIDEKCSTPFTTTNTCSTAVGQCFASEGQAHVAQGSVIDWVHNPPHSGPHYPSPASSVGEYAQPLARGTYVHNLEHGWVVLAYHCTTACDNELNVLRQVLTERANKRIILTPDPALDAPRFAAIAWTWVYEFDTPDLQNLLCFVDQHEGNAPENL